MAQTARWTSQPRILIPSSSCPTAFAALPRVRPSPLLRAELPSVFTVSIGYMPLINVPITYSNGLKSSIESAGNVYSNVEGGGFPPIGNINTTSAQWTPAYGFGQQTTPAPVTANLDSTYVHPPNLGVAPQSPTGVYPLTSAIIEAVIRCMEQPFGAQLPDASSGFIQCPNSFPILGAKSGTTGFPDVHVGINANDQLYIDNFSGLGLVIPNEDSAGNLFVPGNLSNSTGGIGRYQNGINDSTFQTPTGGVWTTASGSVGAATFTANTTDVTSPQLDNTALKAIMPTMTGSQEQGLLQVVPASLTAGLPYTWSIYAQSPVAGVNFELQMVGITGCVLPGGTTIIAANKWQRFQLTCTPATTGTYDVDWFSATSNATIYVWDGQVEQAPSAGVPVCTTSAAVSGVGNVSKCATCDPASSVRARQLVDRRPLQLP